MITLFTANPHKDKTARRIFELFNIPYEEFEGSSLAESLGHMNSPIIRDSAGIVYCGDEFFKKNVSLLSLGETCPNCCILKEALKKANIPFAEITDKEILKEAGFSHYPVLIVNGIDGGIPTVMQFKEAYKTVQKFISEGGA